MGDNGRFEKQGVLFNTKARMTEEEAFALDEKWCKNGSLLLNECSMKDLAYIITSCAGVHL